MKILKPTITLILLITLLVSAIREKHTSEKIINNLLYQEENMQLKTKSHHFKIHQIEMKLPIHHALFCNLISHKRHFLEVKLFEQYEHLLKKVF